jgi:hypothetical protein
MLHRAERERVTAEGVPPARASAHSYLLALESRTPSDIPRMFAQRNYSFR